MVPIAAFPHLPLSIESFKKECTKCDVDDLLVAVYVDTMAMPRSRMPGERWRLENMLAPHWARTNGAVAKRPRATEARNHDSQAADNSTDSVFPPFEQLLQIERRLENGELITVLRPVSHRLLFKDLLYNPNKFMVAMDQSLNMKTLPEWIKDRVKKLEKPDTPSAKPVAAPSAAQTQRQEMLRRIDGLRAMADKAEKDLKAKK